MTSVDWTRLEPHRPLARETMGLYVPRLEGGAARLAQLLRAGAKMVAVVGPTGSGKSTELAVVATELILDADYFVSVFLLDHWEISTPDSLETFKDSIFAILAAALARHAEGRGMQLSVELTGKLKDTAEDLGSRVAGRGEDLLLETLREVRRAGGQKKTVLLLCDGLEKYAADRAREVLEGLLRFRSEAVLVLVVPTALVVGPGSYDVISNFKLFPVRPVPVQDEAGFSGREGRAFLKEIAYRRLEIDLAAPGLDPVLERAAEASGGVPRAFLQLVLDSAMYARLAEREWPTLEDLEEAKRDHAESLRRLLIKGDVDALRAADGTDGLEVEPERRLRFLTHGLLLEYKLGDRVVVHPAPLLAGILARSSGA
jgi:hypothetical protein